MGIGEESTLLKRARPFEGENTFEERGALLGEGMFILTWWLDEGAPFLQRARPFGKRALPKCHNEL